MSIHPGLRLLSPRSVSRIAAVSALLVTVSMSVAASVPFGPRGGTGASAPPPVAGATADPVGELPGRTTAGSATRHNANGSYTTTLYGGLVNYRAPDGQWRPIDSNLYPASGDGYAWRSGANGFQARFAANATAAGFAELRVGGWAVRTTVVGTTQGTANATARRTAVRPGRVDGAQIAYPEAFDGADLRYRVRPDGVEEVIDLLAPYAPASYTFRLTGDGGMPAAGRRPDGSYLIRLGPKKGDLVLEAPVVREGDDESAATAAKPALTVRRDGRDLLVTLSLDRDWLQATGRRFPVHLDPTITIQHDENRVYSFRSVGGPWGSNAPMMGSDASTTWRAAMQFSLGAIPPGATVNSAQLRVYYRACIISSTPCATSHQLDAHRITNPWTELSAPAFDPTASGSYTLAAGAPFGWMAWPVGGLVSAWLNGTQPNYGFVVKRHIEALGSGGPVGEWPNSTNFPRLDVTYTLTAPFLEPPTRLHANGAELSWAPSGSGTGTAGFEVHRSAAASFTPGAATLVATIGDRSQTTFRDTTAAAGQTFTYRVKDLTDGSLSVPRTVTLPPAGEATMVLQPGPVDGRGTFVRGTIGSAADLPITFDNCENSGVTSGIAVGSEWPSGVPWDGDGYMYRGLLGFDVRDIPARANVTGATLSLWRRSGAFGSLTVDVHRVTRPWQEGTGYGVCTGDGASWSETAGGQLWSAGGVDYDPAVAASLTIPGSTPAFDNFAVTGLVQGWANGTVPNHGLLLRAADDETSGVWADYDSDDFMASPSLRPKLTITYQDTSGAETPQPPKTVLAAPGPGAVVNGAAVTLAAAADDDRRVEQVQFLVNGAVVGTDATAPFAVGWDSSATANGAKSLTVRATDDAGNVTTSAPVSVTVDNTALPSGALTAPATGSILSGDMTLSATAADDVGVASVAFLVDGVQVGTPVTAPPYQLIWRTLDPLASAANGTHQLTAVVTDTSGQQVTTAARSVTVNNLGATLDSVSFALNDPVSTVDDVMPAVMTANINPGVPVQDPYAGTTNPDGTTGGSLNRALGTSPHDDAPAPPPICPGGAYCPSVTVTNTSGATWNSSTAKVWYRWYAANGAVMFEGPASGSFPATFAAGASQAFPLTIYPPALPPGSTQGTFQLRIDVFDPATSTWFAAKGNPPVDNPVVVTQSLDTKLGLERFHQYDGAPLGAGASNLVNVANGNLIVRWSPFFAAGRGLATLTDLTYNSLEDHSTSPAGNNFSLSMSGLARIGEPIDIHPNKADQISGQANKFVEFTDGDGSTHRFTGTTGSDGITRWQEPAGVNLYLRSLPTTDQRGRWALTRPDKVTYFFDADGYPTMVEDRNGNRITYTVQDTPPGENPGGPKRRITAVTDAGGRSFTIEYWSKAEVKKAHVRGNIKRISDHTSSALDFDYYDDGNLLRLTQRGGTNADGSFLPDRPFVFTYTTSSGAGPAIPSASARVNPEPKTSNQSTRLFSVRDPRGTETTYAYYLAPDGPQLRWKLKSRTDRSGQTTSYGYDLANRLTTVTAPLGRVSRFGYDTTGKVTSIVNAKSQTTTVAWTADFKVAQVTEPSGRSTGYTYNPNGYTTSRTNQAGERTELTYLDQPVDADDSGNHLSLVSTVTNPMGVATPTVPGDFQWRYSYDPAGNIDKITDPTGAVTDYDYNPPGSANPGLLAAVHDANGNAPTTYPAYDPSGQPTQIRDPLGNVTQVGYDADGLIRYIQDANHASDNGADVRAYRTYFDYDSFGRLGRQSAPKSTAGDRGTLLWSGAAFDPNDNTVRDIDPHLGPITGDPGTAAVTVTAYDAMDRPILSTGPDRSADPAGERTSFVYDAAGRLSKMTQPRGVASATVDDFTTLTEYDPLDRVVKETVFGASTAEARVTQMCFDLAGDLRSVTYPRAGTATIACPGTGPANAAFTTEYDYDAAHRPVVQRDEAGHAQRTGYDANGNVRFKEKDIASGRVSRTDIDYDQRDAPIVSRERIDGATGRVATTRIEYDANGNRFRLISPRASDTGGNGPYTSYVTGYQYDANNRLTRIALPFDGKDGTERQFVHRAYDGNGNLLWTSLPVTAATAGAVADTARTVMTYFDPGWIRTSDDPGNPKVHFDYDAQGRQTERVPENSSGGLNEDRQMTWQYYLDGQLQLRKDQGGQPSTYSYDADNNLVSSVDSSGVTDPTEHAVETQATYTGFDEVDKVRHRKQTTAVWKFTGYTYDDNGNVTVRLENGEENDAGVQSKAPRRYQLAYDSVNWLSQQLDLGTDANCTDDTRTVNAWVATGWEQQRDVYRGGASCTADPSTWTKKQTTTWIQFDNGLLRKLETRNGSGTLTESHDVDYITNNVYVNGNRTTDHYVLERADGNTAQTCRTANPCDAQYEYDARDRLIRHQQRATKEIRYTFDEAAKLLGDNTIRAGNMTSEVKDGQTISRRFTGTRLTDATIGPATAKYWYDPGGNLDCVTTSGGSQSNCSPSDDATPSNLIADYGYDYLNRLATSRMYDGSSQQTDKSTYTYDALDRTSREVEDHQDPAKDRSTDFTYQGLSGLVTEEKQSGGTNPKTKTYGYDNYGHRLQLTDRNNTTGTVDTYTYGTDEHGSISQLITDAGKVKASYGYDAYGGTDSTDGESLTTGDTDPQAPLNPYRYAGKRADSGTAPSVSLAGPAGAGQYDMGARRFGPDLSSFLQQDQFYTALGDLGLALDPLTQNTYALAGGNPISYVEYDGHMLIRDGGGGSSTSSNPTTSSSGSSSGSSESESGGGSEAENPDWVERVRPNWRTFTGAGLDYSAGLLKERGDEAIKMGRLRAGLHLNRAQTPSSNRLLRLPGVRSVRKAYWTTRATLSEAKGNFVGKTLRGAGHLTSGLSAGLSAVEGWDEQQKIDSHRSDLGSTERGIRSGIRAGATGVGTGLGAVGGEALCGPACGVAGAWLGKQAGNYVGDTVMDFWDNVDWSPQGDNVGEKAVNLAGDIASEVPDALNPF